MILLTILRSALASVFFVLFTVLWSSLALLEALCMKHRRLEAWIMSAWGRVGLWIFGVKLEVKGTENIPKGGCLFLFNHTSFFDIFAMVAAYEDFRFGAKIELFKIPLFGAAMKHFGILPIARSRREEVFRVYQEAQERAKRGEKFALSPEGKRNVSETLLPFKSGPFVFAINSQIPLVPVVIKGAWAVMEKGWILPNWNRWSRTISIFYLPAIETAGSQISDRSELQNKVYQEMKPYFEDPNGSL